MSVRTNDRNGFPEYWRSRIPSDLHSFSDPGSLVEVREDGSDLRARWTVRGKEREAAFSFSADGSVGASFNGDSSSYGSFLSRPEVGDLEQVARMILRASRPTRFVSTEAELEGADGPEPAIALLSRLIEAPSETATRLVVLTGEPGSGKTALLRELVARQADRYLRGETKRLLLYVDVQGRSLARLYEALTAELQELQVRLTYHTVAALARSDLVIPVIDGLDELLGVRGYDDAFSSLSTLLDTLEGEGCVVASARSTYCEEEFISRETEVYRSARARWRQIPVRLRCWGEEQRAEFVERWAGAHALTDDERSEVSRRLAGVFSGKGAEFGGLPFFVTEVVDLLARRPDFGPGGDLLDEIVAERLERERLEKFLDRRSSPLFTREQFRRLMQGLALEMWRLAIRELDDSSLRDLADHLTETEEVSEEWRKALLGRLPSLAFLRPGEGDGGPGRVAFAHELFFFYFLAGALTSEIRSAKPDLYYLLSRGPLPEEVAARVARGLRGAIREDGPNGAQRLFDRLHQAGSVEWRRTEQVRENIGRLAAAMFREGAAVEEAPGHGPAIAGVSVRGMVLPGGDLSGLTFFRCAFESVELRRADLAGARFVECEAKDLVLVEPRVDPESTWLDLQGLSTGQVHGIRLPGRNGSAYDPEVIRETLRTCGVAVARPAPGAEPAVAPDIVGLVERLAQAYGRANPVCPEDEGLRKFLSGPEWEQVKRRLLRHGIAVRETPEMRGPAKEFLRRRYRPDQIMAALDHTAEVDPRIRIFWKSLASPVRDGGRQPATR